MKQKVEQELVDVLSNNSSDPNSGDVEALEVNEKLLRKFFGTDYVIRLAEYRQVLRILVKT